MVTKLTERQKADYLKDPTYCPYCGAKGPRIQWGDVCETPAEMVRMENYCFSCERIWNDVLSAIVIGIQDEDDMELENNAEPEV